MKILVACEESQRVCEAFRQNGHEAYSCDILPWGGGHPEWHIMGDVLPLVNGHCDFHTMDMSIHRVDGKWDMLIAHPPCTYLSNVATRAFSLRVTPPEKVVERWEKRAKAAVFFMQIMLADCDKIAVENPKGFMSKAYRKPDQYINPWMFADGVDDIENYHSKLTGLWLKGLKPLKGKGKVKTFSCSIYGQYSSGKNKTWEDSISRDAGVRSVTFPGIAKAMADQWGGINEE